MQMAQRIPELLVFRCSPHLYVNVLMCIYVFPMQSPRKLVKKAKPKTLRCP